MTVLKWCGAMVFATALSAVSADASTLWYNGDFNGSNALSNEQNTLVTSAYVYDNFVVGAGGWTITSVWSNDLADFTASGAIWEIRSGLSTGNGGTIVASGTSAVTQTATGRSGFGYTEYQFLVDGLNIFVAPGTYWLTVSPIDSGNGRSFNSTTSNLNGIGTFLLNGSFFTSTFFGANFDPATGRIGGATRDFSMGIGGIAGTPVPEPSSLALTGTALLLALRTGLRRRQRK